MTPFPSFSFSHFLIFTLLSLTSKSTFSLFIHYPDENPNFETDTALFGEAKFVNGGSSVQLNRPTASSSGLLIHNKPFKFSSLTSFSTDFTFTISPQNGDGISMVIVPTFFPSKFPLKSSFGLSRDNPFLFIKFYTTEDGNLCNLVSPRVSNVSKINLVLNTGVKLSSWVDYRASLKRLDVRLSKWGYQKPVYPTISYPIDLGEMWRGQEVYLGLISSSGASMQSTSVYSWSSKIENVPKWLHSQPINPHDYSTNTRGELKSSHKKSVCFLSGFIFAMGCGALAALALLFLWSIFVGRDKIQRELPVCPVDFRYEKIDMVAENSSEGVKK